MVRIVERRATNVTCIILQFRRKEHWARCIPPAEGAFSFSGVKGFTFPKVGLSLPYLSVEKLEYLVVQDTVPVIMAGAGYLIGAELIPRFVKVSQWAQ